MALAAAFRNSEHNDNFSDPSFVLDTTGVVTGDLMLVVLGTSENFGGDVALTPAGWTQVENVNWDAGASNSFLGVWRKIATTDAPSETFAFTDAHSCPHTAIFIKVTGVAALPTFSAISAIDGDIDGTAGISNVSYLDGELVVVAYIADSFFSIQDISAGPTGFTQMAKIKNTSVNVMAKTMAVYTLVATADGSTSGLSVTTAESPRDTRSLVFRIGAGAAIPGIGGGGMGFGFGIGRT